MSSYFSEYNVSVLGSRASDSSYLVVVETLQMNLQILTNIGLHTLHWPGAVLDLKF